MKTNEQHGTFQGPAEVRLVRTLTGPIERVWDYLTDPQKRVRWLSGGIFEPHAGGKIEFNMHHKNLAPNETPPEEWKHVHDPGVTFEGVVLKCEPPRLLVHTFGGPDSEVTFELTPKDDQVQLVITHRAKGEDLPEMSNFASGWHIHTDFLIALLNGTPPPALWPNQTRLKTEYEKLHANA